MDKIIIEVRKGLIEAVYSNNPDILVRVLDWDCIDSQNMTKTEKHLLAEIRTMEDIL